MSSRTFSAKGIVLKKTKLGESDLIITFLAEDGSLMQGVAKGARKPTSSFSSRLELFSCADMFCAQGRGLPIISDARLVDAHQTVREDFDCCSCASTFAELLAKTAQEDLPVPRLFAMASAYFACLEQCTAAQAAALTVAALLKVFAFCGIRPSFSSCVSCGSAFQLDTPGDLVAFSYLDGGYTCNDCHGLGDGIMLDKHALSWMNFMLSSSFADVVGTSIPSDAITFGLQLCQEWTRTHLGMSLKSIVFLLTSVNYQAM